MFRYERQCYFSLIFIAIYILAGVFFLPGSILTLGAGVLFGVIKGSIIVSISATLGATCAFLVGRYLARDWVDTFELTQDLLDHLSVCQAKREENCLG